MKYTGPTLEAREAAAALLDKAYALPTRGVPVGGGRHVPMPDIWDGLGPVPPGWTSFQGHRNTNDDAAVFLPDEPETQTKLNRLTGTERAMLASIRATAQPNAQAAKENRT